MVLKISTTKQFILKINDLLNLFNYFDNFAFNKIVCKNKNSSFHFIENILRCNLCFKKCVLLQFLASGEYNPY